MARARDEKGRQGFPGTFQKVLFLDKDAFGGKDPGWIGLLQALLVVTLAGILYSFSDFWVIRYVYNSGITGVMQYFGGLFFNWILLVWILMAILMHATSKLAGGRAHLRRYVTFIGFSQAPMALGALGALPYMEGSNAGIALGFLWTNLCYLITTREVHELSIYRSVIAVYLPMTWGVIILLHSGIGL